MGELDPPAFTVEVSNPACGDILRLSVAPEDGRIQDARYRVRGCVASIAAGSVLTCLLVGMSRAEVSGLTAARIEEALGGLPAESRHAAALCLDGIKALLTKRPD